MKNFSLIFILFIGFSVFSQTKTNKKPQPAVQENPLDRSIRPKAGPAPQINIKDSEVFTLGNGLTVILSENNKIPKVSFNLVFSSSPEMEKEKTGLSEITGQLVMSGTSKRNKDQLDNEMDYIGATINASSTSVYLSCLKKHLTKALDIYTDIIQNAQFPLSEFDRIIKQTESELLSVKSNPDGIVKNIEKVANFSGHPYGEVVSENTIKNITREDVIAYYKKHFSPNGSYLVVVGDITKEELTQVANQYFLSWFGKVNEKKSLNEGNFNKDSRVIFVKKPGAVQSTISITFPVKIKPGKEDHIALNVVNEIIGGSAFASRLMQNLRENKAYTYGCYSRLNVTEFGSWISAKGNFRNEVSDSAITQILYELKRITSELVSDEDLSLIKASISGSFARSLENPSTVARFALNIIQYGLPKDYYQTYLKQLDQITKEDILRIAQKYIDFDHPNIIVVGNEEILSKLKVFDKDGKIEILDAFGNASKDRLKTDITKEKLIENYILMLTQSKNMGEAQKKIKKIKSMKQSYELTSPLFPGSLSMTNYFATPNKEAMKMEMQGMLLQKTYFDGLKGGSMNMQTGKSEMTEEEIKIKQKSVGLIPELSYLNNQIEYELLGIEEQDGKLCYVLKVVEGNEIKLDYFEKTSFYKYKTNQLKEEGESVLIFSDYKDVSGILFPHSISILAGEISMNGKITSIEVNSKIDNAVFQP
ncbi:MAG: insulinase family protein [Flavobacteriia bacterium]|nr:insulinase family protein [Flavobacteriia bacterium]